MDPKADEESSYQVIAYPGHDLPKQFYRLIKSSFLNFLRSGNDYFALIDGESFNRVYPKYIEALINKPDSVIRLAILSDNETVLGWSLCEKDILHFVWVKKIVWEQGIGKSLIPQGITRFTHVTRKALRIWTRPNYKNMRFDPFA